MCSSDLELLQGWRTQIGSQHRRRARRGMRPLAALSYLAHGPVVDGLIDLRRLVLVILHDLRRGDVASVIRVAGYTGAVVPWGVMLGGANHIRFDKHLSLAPEAGARGRRLDSAQGELLSLALQLDRQLERHLNYPHLPRRSQPRLPKLWAAVDPAIADELCREGQQFMEHASLESLPPGSPWATSRRELAGLSLLPLELISHGWQRFTTVFADLRRFPKRQVFPMDRPAFDLGGFDGAIEFEFFKSRFSIPPSCRRQGRRRRQYAAASIVG